MKQRLSQGKVLRASRVVGRLIAAVHDARVRFHDCQKLRPAGLVGLAQLLKQLSRLPQASDYTPHEVALKRRIIGANKKLHGTVENSFSRKHALARKLPPCYYDSLEACDKELCRLLKVLADVKV